MKDTHFMSGTDLPIALMTKCCSSPSRAPKRWPNEISPATYLSNSHEAGIYIEGKSIEKVIHIDDVICCRTNALNGID